MPTAVEFFLKIEGIQGDSRNEAHKGEIELLSFTWGATNSEAVDHPGPGKVSHLDFSFTADTGRASPQLFLGVTTGKRFPTATVTGVRMLKEPVSVLKLEFKQVLISSYRLNETAGAEVPIDEAAFNFSQVQYTVTPANPDGTAGTPVVTGWDVAENRQI